MHILRYAIAHICKMHFELLYQISTFGFLLQNYRMNQPLAHLYFLTVLEHLHVKYDGYDVTTLASLVTDVNDVCL